MNRVIEATCADGTHQLLPISRLHEYAKAASDAANGNSKRALRNFEQMVVNMMHLRGYTVLTEIAYNCAGQKRTTIAWRIA